MPHATSPKTSSGWRRKRPAIFLSAGLVAAMLAIGAPLAANAAPSSATITLNVSKVTAWGQFSVVSGGGFGPGDALSFTLDGIDVTNQLVNPTADGSGDITSSFGTLHFPNGGSIGSHTLVVTDTSDTTLTASSTIEVVADLTPTPATATRTLAQMASSGVAVSFSGFTAGAMVNVGMFNSALDGGLCDSVAADSNGVVAVTCVWDAAFAALHGGAVKAGEYTIGANTVDTSMFSSSVIVTVGDPATPAAPAVPVKSTASFTG
ncbi:hypothetical protein OSC27_01280 [Microbacterium sp. STN6]|uniref:hypothetical protein n=1 Tax=Microbacterium sp. STN6 TaxID=2995588 RepID=UPI002260E207|nr:hypothetical protein [Microbacterium sp. STN6]MCX7520903.1 hypothetical protein [Microbacterium sp. STN6]